MNKLSRTRTALVGLTLLLPWTLGAAPADGEQDQNRPASEPPTPSECTEIRQDRENLLQENTSGNVPPDYQEARKKMDATTRQRLDSLEAQLKRCR